MMILLLMVICLGIPLAAQEFPAPQRILFLGNSITLHAPAPDIGWKGNWGMAASAAEKDYVHLMVAGLTKDSGVHPDIRVRNIADFERGLTNYDPVRSLESELAFRPQLVIVAVGENAADPSTPEARQLFAAAMDRLLAELKKAGAQDIVVRSCFWPHETKDRLLREAAGRAGAAFVDIRTLGLDPANAARSEREFSHDGVAGHPGDAGMKAIAGALLAAIRQRSAGGAVILRGTTETELAPHGLGNVYAPDVIRDGDRWRIYYGAQGRDGHDRIHLAESSDGFSWHRRGVVIDCGTANHVNDPSVVRREDVWWMFYTVAESGEQDEIAAATSRDGIAWEKRGTVFRHGTGAVWDSAKVGRPSVQLESGRFRLWYDGQPTADAATTNDLARSVLAEGRAVGYAESADGFSWKRRAEPVFRNGAGAVQVVREGGRYVMLIESHGGVRWAESADGLTWRSRGLLTGLSGGESDAFGMVTPCFVRLQGQNAILYGAASRRTWDGNAIAVKPVYFPTQTKTP